MGLTCGSLFAGIGGFDLGFERAGIKTIWQVEIDPYCRRVLAKHFPDATRFNDVRLVHSFEHCPAIGIQDATVCGNCLDRVDVITGGFPCQDVSQCGPRVGIDGERSGLWAEMHRIVRALRPKYVVVENVSGLLDRGIERVLGDLAEIGYDAEWHCICAAQVGLPHIRERVWIVAYPEAKRVAQGRTEKGRSKARFAMPPSDVRITDWREDSARLRGADDGLSGKLDRGCALGNAVVPQIAEWIGRRILAAEKGEQ